MDMRKHVTRLLRERWAVKEITINLLFLKIVLIRR